MALVFAVMHLHNNYFSIAIASDHSFFILFFKSDIDNSTEWSMIPACPSLTCFFKRGSSKGTNSSKILCLMVVSFLFYVGLCQD